MRPTHFRPSLKSGTPEAKTYLLMKRHQLPGRTVYAWESLVLLPQLTDLMLPPARLVGRGWTEIVTRTLRNGTEGCSMRACMEWCVRDQSDSSDLNAREAVQMVEMLKSEHSQSLSSSSQSLENLLLDEAVREKKQGVTGTLV